MLLDALHLLCLTFPCAAFDVLEHTAQRRERLMTSILLVWALVQFRLMFRTFDMRRRCGVAAKFRSANATLISKLCIAISNGFYYGSPLSYDVPSGYQHVDNRFVISIV